MSSHRALVVVAHPDDETFGLGSVIALLAAEGAEVTVCCATRGEAGEAPGLPAGTDLGAVREAELHAAGEILGVRRVVLLDYRDSGMTGGPEPGTLAAAPVDEVASAVRRVVDDVDPQLVVTLDPDHGDGHRDHVQIARATVVACAGRDRTAVYYGVLGREQLRAWFAFQARAHPDREHLGLDLDEAGLGRADSEVTTVLDVRAHRPLRDRAMAAHASQRSPFDGLPDDLVDAFLDTDRLVRVQPPWPGGRPESTLLWGGGG